MDVIVNSKRLLDLFYTATCVPLAVRSCIMKVRYGAQIRKISSCHNEYKGQRCYILGNGPSLIKIDFSRLIGKNVITVNRLYKYPQYGGISPLFHCALDSGLYQEPDLSALLRILEKGQDTRMLVSTNAPIELREHPNCFTVGFGYLPSSAIRPFNLAKPSAAFVNVICFAIELAIYLGFSEIVLLGCDFSQFAARREKHVYDSGKSDERKATVWQDLLGHYIAYIQHESLYCYAQKKEVDVVNATEGSFLEVYPLASMEDWL